MSRVRVWRSARVRPALAGGLIAAVAALAAWGNADLRSPPRFDGAGYAVLAEALASGRGYREIDNPAAPRHAHFPPGYPVVLAALRLATGGRSERSAHGLSLACTAAAAAAAWRWFRTMYAPRVAWLLGMALAVNWTWARTGASIQSEPLFLLLEALAWLAATRAARLGGAGRGGLTGVFLGASTLTRHVGVALGGAALLHLVLRRRRAPAMAAGIAATVMVVPWVVWLATVRENTQAGMLALPGRHPGLVSRVAAQGRFYVQRLPDQWTGPVVEIGTVFQRRAVVAAAVNTWAGLATAVLVFGWARTLRTPRRRVAGLSALATLALLLVWPFTEAGRFLIPLVPCLLVGAVEGLAALLARVGRVRRPRGLAAAAVLAVSIPYTAYVLVTDRAGAERRTHTGFDAACAWIAREAVRPGPVLTRHPGEVYWQTGRHALAPAGDAPGAVGRDVDRWEVAYLLIDEDRYANSPINPLTRFVGSQPGRVRQVWARDDGRASVRVFEVVSGSGPRNGAGRNPHIGGSSAGSAGPSS